MKPETIRLFLTPGAVWRRVNGDVRLVCVDLPPTLGLVRFHRLHDDESILLSLECVGVSIFPDGTHPATLGIAIGLARKAWGDPLAILTNWIGDGGIVFGLWSHGDCVGSWTTEFDALVAAIEAAPAAGGAG